MSSNTRYADLDWLRVVAILLLHVFHSGMMFNTWDWHIKAPQLLPVLDTPMHVLHLIRMPLLMVVAGMGTALALKKRSLAAFALDRTKRLLLPVLFGMLVIVPPQIYVERVFLGQFQGSYLDFFPSVFRFVPYPKGGSTSWHHLWFVVYLFVYGMASLPLFGWLKTAAGEATLRRVGGWLGRGANVVWLLVPLAVGRAVVRRYDETHDLIHDPNTLLYYGQLFLFGHLLGRCPDLMQRVVELRFKLLAALLVVFVVMALPNEFPTPFEQLGTEAFVWTTLLVCLGFARSLVTTRRPWLAYAQERAYPFYILHQTVIVVLGWRLLALDVAPWTRFACVLGLSLVVTCALCEVVAKVSFLRPFFGMGPARAAVRARAAVPATSH